MNTSDVINSKLEIIFHNGRAEVGLEVGADPGLSPNEYINIPQSFKKRFATKQLGTGGYERKAADRVADLQGKEGWTVYNPGDRHILIHDGNYYTSDAQGNNRVQIYNFYMDSFTYDDIRRFIVVNTGHIRDQDIQQEDIWWVHAVRFWSVVTGLVTGTKQREWVQVNDPTENLDSANDLVERIVGFADNAITAAAARAANWRKSNHATGGQVAVGFPRRWLAKNGFWRTAGDRAALMNAHTQATTSFYIATHAVCVHNALAMMAPSDTAHWAVVDPSYGFFMQWDIKESTAIRISPKTQVAGTAIVVDSLVVIKMLIGEGLFPLLESAGDFPALRNAYRQVEQNGVRAASYASWFLNGHPQNLGKVNFSQKDAAYSSLVGELGAVARFFYRRSTIGESPALDNAMQQLATESAKARWQQLARAKQSSSNEAVLMAYRKVAGASAGRAIQQLISDDVTVVTQGVAEYNQITARVAADLGIMDPPTLDVDRVMSITTAGPGMAVVDEE